MPKAHILIVEDNLLVGSTLRDILTDEEYAVSLVEDGKAAGKILRKESFPVALLDMMLPDTDGRALLEKWRRDYPQMEIIMSTAYGDVETAVNCMRAGAYSYLEKPVERVKLMTTIEKALEHQSLNRRVNVLTQLNRRRTEAPGLDQVIGSAPAMHATVEMAEMIARSDFSCLLITGESGTGKGLFAQSVHASGCRRDKPFVEVNCSALPATLIESELFGHKRGSFTDAKEDRVGLFEMADGGTLFLDEIGDMDVALQSKLLKVIEDQRFRRLGSTEDIRVDVAIIAATNQNIQEQVDNGQFRMDLYYRLNVIPLHLPPLRDRVDDVPKLVAHFVGQFSRRLGKEIEGFTDEAMDAMLKYPWPGNVRELRNVVERGCILTREPRIGQAVLMFPPSGPSVAAGASGDFPVMPLADAERRLIEATLRQAGGNKNQAARTLGIHRTTLYKKIEEYGIAVD